MKLPTGEIPTLHTERLVMRPFRLDDAAEVQRLAGEYAVAKPTAHIPHPYEDGMAEAWIAGHDAAFGAGRAITWAITNREAATLIGAISIHLSHRNESGEIGYWVGRPYWQNRFCTEAAKAIVDYGFRTLELHRICARHVARNPASGRVMQKIGMQYEGTQREADKRWGEWHDLWFYSMLRSEWL